MQEPIYSFTKTAMMEKKYMDLAIELSITNIQHGGGPFGAVIVKEGEIIAASANSVVPSNDPTAHAEVNAIRDACRKLGTHDLSGCDLYASCEPCPMCLGAIYWARISRLYYANTKDDAGNIGFADSFIYSEFALPYKERKLPTIRMINTKAIEAFQIWEKKEDKTKY